MSNALKRLLDLIPKAPEFVGTITHEDHPQYKVLVVDGSGLVMCTSSTKYVGRHTSICIRARNQAGSTTFGCCYSNRSLSLNNNIEHRKGAFLLPKF